MGTGGALLGGGAVDTVRPLPVIAAVNSGPASFDVNINSLTLPFNTAVRLDPGWTLVAPGALQWSGPPLDHVELYLTMPLTNAAGGQRKNPTVRIEQAFGAVTVLGTSQNQYIRNLNGHTDPAFSATCLDPNPVGTPLYRCVTTAEAAGGTVNRVPGIPNEFVAKAVLL